MSEQEPNNEQQQQNPTPNNGEGADVLDKFNSIKTRYENELTQKDKRIKELEAQLAEKDKEVDDTIQNLNNEVNEKLEQAEELRALQANVQELLHDKAEALVDKYIHEGKLVPAQKDKALSLCLSDQDMFIELYENAPSLIDTNPRPRSHKVMGNVEKMVDYFKN